MLGLSLYLEERSLGNSTIFRMPRECTHSIGLIMANMRLIPLTSYQIDVTLGKIHNESATAVKDINIQDLLLPALLNPPAACEFCPRENNCCLLPNEEWRRDNRILSSKRIPEGKAFVCTSYTDQHGNITNGAQNIIPSACSLSPAEILDSLELEEPDKNKFVTPTGLAEEDIDLDEVDGIPAQEIILKRLSRILIKKTADVSLCNRCNLPCPLNPSFKDFTSFC